MADEIDMAGASVVRQHRLARSYDIPTRIGRTATGRRQATAFMSRTLQTPIDQRRDHAIPTHIHRFWSGGPMSHDAMATLNDSAEKIRAANVVNGAHGARWHSTMWYSSSLEHHLERAGHISPGQAEFRDAQRNQLRHQGYRVRPIEDLAQRIEQPSRLRRAFGAVPTPRAHGRTTREDWDRMAHRATQLVGAGGATKYDGVKHMSDLARLQYLHAEGGHHFDVDMGLGHMDLGRQYYHNDQAGHVPLMGSLAVTDADPIAGHLARVRPGAARNLRRPAQAHGVHAVTLHARDTSIMLNGMMASRAGTGRMGDAVEALRSEAVQDVSHASGMMLNRPLVHGPAALSAAQQTQARGQTVPPYLLDLQHFTAESSNR